MKKIYLSPETTRFELFGGEALLQSASAASATVDVNDKGDDDEVSDIEDLLSKPGDSVWED